MNINYQLIKNLLLLYFLVFTFSALQTASAKESKYEFVVAKDIVQAVRKKFKSFNSYQADFTISMVQGKHNNLRKGTIYFRKPDKVHMDFSYPHNQVVISDGEKVWIYLPRLKLLGEQDLKKKSKNSIFSRPSPVGLDRLFSLYHYSFQPGDQPRKMAGQNANSESFYILNLKQKVLTSGFRKMEVWVDTSYFIRKVIAENAFEKTIKMEFSNVQTDKTYDDQLFTLNKKKYKIKSVIQNPLVQP